MIVIMISVINLIDGVWQHLVRKSRVDSVAVAQSR